MAKRVAGELGYEYVNRPLPVVVAKRFGISPEEVDANGDTGRTLGERCSRVWNARRPSWRKYPTCSRLTRNC